MLMTLRKTAVALAAISACAGFIACNSNTETVSATLASSTAVGSFRLANNDSVLAHLDSVFFSIDLVKGTVFNADSLPYGTKVNKLVPVISTMETAALIELKVSRANGTDTTYNYSENPSDTIDFTNPVTLRIVSANGDNERNYTVTVNVHKMKSDSLTWNTVTSHSLPSALQAPTAQRTVRGGDSFYCLTTDGANWSLATNSVGLSGLNGAEMPADAWTATGLNLPFAPRLETFSATDNAIFLLDEADALWKSEDNGQSWQPTGMTWANVYGGHRNLLIGNIRQSDGSWMLQTYPDGALAPLPDGMPVSGASVPVLYYFEMSQMPQTLIVGGRKADGTLSAATWGFDGTSWARVSKRDLPVALEGVAVAPYRSFTVSAGWSVRSYATMLAFGGRLADGSLSSTVYMSNDYGYNWTTADATLQLPADIPAFADAQAYVMASTFRADVVPAIVKPIESWECPYIYLFGGTNAEGTLDAKIRRGVINRLMFRPIE